MCAYGVYRLLAQQVPWQGFETNTSGAETRKAFILNAAPALFQSRQMSSLDNRAVESIGSSKHFYMFMWFLGRRGLFSLLDLLCPTAFPLTADEHKELPL